MRRPLATAPAIALLIVAAAIALGGCGERWGSVRSKEASWPEDRREEVASWHDQARTKTVHCASGTSTIRVEWLDDHTVCYRFDEGKPVSLARAVVLTGDGYALTAAHAVSATDPLWSMIRGGLTARCRIVWHSGWSESDRSIADWAIIRIDHDFSEVCEWTAWLPAKDDVVIAAGQASPSFGRVGRVWPFRRDGMTWYIITHSAPLDAGDSGSALLDDAGSLLGIHYGADPDASRGYAVRPDPALVAKLIAEDRSTHATAGEDAPAESQEADPQPGDGGETTPLSK